MSGTVKHNIGRKYVPNLPNMLAVCDANYMRLIKLLPDCDTEQLHYQFGVTSGLRYQIRIVECSRYTSTLDLQQMPDQLPDFLQPSMRVRIYHDAKMAEVLTCQHIGNFDSSYSYPNNQMHQKNEKEMVNRFLAEWLIFCLTHIDSRAEFSAD